MSAPKTAERSGPIIRLLYPSFWLKTPLSGDLYKYFTYFKALSYQQHAPQESYLCVSMAIMQSKRPLILFPPTEKSSYRLGTKLPIIGTAVFTPDTYPIIRKLEEETSTSPDRLCMTRAFAISSRAVVQRISSVQGRYLALCAVKLYHQEGRGKLRQR